MQRWKSPLDLRRQSSIAGSTCGVTSRTPNRENPPKKAPPELREVMP